MIDSLGCDPGQIVEMVNDEVDDGTFALQDAAGDQGSGPPRNLVESFPCVLMSPDLPHYGSGRDKTGTEWGITKDSAIASTV